MPILTRSEREALLQSSAALQGRDVQHPKERALEVPGRLPSRRYVESQGRLQSSSVDEIQDSRRGERLQDAYQALNYNQQLIQFADSKAGNLIVINSLFVAAAQAQTKLSLLTKTCQSVSVLLAAAAVVLCLTVITSKVAQSPQVKPGRGDLLFFGDILRRHSPEGYHRDLAGTSDAVALQEATHRTYALAKVAASKFAAYGWAQRATAVAAYLWVATQVLSVLSL